MGNFTKYFVFLPKCVVRVRGGEHTVRYVSRMRKKCSGCRGKCQLRVRLPAKPLFCLGERKRAQQITMVSDTMVETVPILLRCAFRFFCLQIRLARAASAISTRHSTWRTTTEATRTIRTARAAFWNPTRQTRLPTWTDRDVRRGEAMASMVPPPKNSCRFWREKFNFCL